MSCDENCECGACLDAGCRFCAGNDFFENPPVCVCTGDLDDGFFGGCDDFAFGGREISFKAGCPFENVPQQVFAVLPFLAIFVCLCACGMIRRRMQIANTGTSTGVAFTVGAMAGHQIAQNSVNQNPTGAASPPMVIVTQHQQPLQAQSDIPVAAAIEEDNYEHHVHVVQSSKNDDGIRRTKGWF